MKKTPKMSSLAMAANAAAQYTEEGSEEEVSDDNTPTQESPMSKASNQDMETNGSEDLGKHLDKLINKAENEEDPQDEEISFGGGQSFIQPPSFARALVAHDLHTPNLPHIFWASIRIPVPLAPSNATDAMFDALDNFITKMKDMGQQFTIFHTTSQNMGHWTTFLTQLKNERTY